MDVQVIYIFMRSEDIARYVNYYYVFNFDLTAKCYFNCLQLLGCRHTKQFMGNGIVENWSNKMHNN